MNRRFAMLEHAISPNRNGFVVLGVVTDAVVDVLVIIELALWIAEVAIA